MEHVVHIKSISPITHEVIQIVVNKPPDYNYIPGQATDVSINEPGWKRKKRSFTFTGLPEEDELRFIIKTYPTHNGVTNHLLQLHKNDSLILHDIFGDIAYQGKGVFIAGGAGITPFIAIFRNNKQQGISESNKLIYANKTQADIILKEELSEIFGKNFINVLSEETADGYRSGFINRQIIEEAMDAADDKFYVCGPPPMMKAVEGILREIGIKKEYVIREQF